jgi:hypothetical protein
MGRLAGLRWGQVRFGFWGMRSCCAGSRLFFWALHLAASWPRPSPTFPIDTLRWCWGVLRPVGMGHSRPVHPLALRHLRRAGRTVRIVAGSRLPATSSSGPSTTVLVAGWPLRHVRGVWRILSSAPPESLDTSERVIVFGAGDGGAVTAMVSPRATPSLLDDKPTSNLRSVVRDGRHHMSMSPAPGSRSDIAIPSAQRAIRESPPRIGPLRLPAGRGSAHLQLGDIRASRSRSPRPANSTDVESVAG